MPLRKGASANPPAAGPSNALPDGPSTSQGHLAQHNIITGPPPPGPSRPQNAASPPPPHLSPIPQRRVADGAAAGPDNAQPNTLVRTRSRNPSIRLRKVPSASDLEPTKTLHKPLPQLPESSQAPHQRQQTQSPYINPGSNVPRIVVPAANVREDAAWQEGRRRSSSEPQRPTWIAPPEAARLGQTATRNSQHMSPIAEGSPDTTSPYAQIPSVEQQLDAPPQRRRSLRRASNAALSALRRSQVIQEGDAQPRRARPYPAPMQEYDARMVDFLDVVDPEVATLSTLTNVQNSLFVPDLGSWLNRLPTYNLTRRAPEAEPSESSSDEEPAEEPAQRAELEAREELEKVPTADATSLLRPEMSRLASKATIKSTLSESRYAVLPHGRSLDGWSPGEKAELNDHVRHMMHSKRAGFKRSMKGFGQYVRRPLGFFVTVYATLITLFGLAWVLFLIGWINVGGRQLYIINVIDNVLVALFAIMGDGLAPFRAVDTYHMCFIAHYHHLTWNLRKEKALPQLQDHNDLPQQRAEHLGYEESEKLEDADFSVLSPKQQARLDHHETKFAKSHTFYKPHETETHHAFPLRLLVAVVVLLDCHSLFQIALGACTWSINYHVRPFALTTVILCCSITCNITAGVLISVGDRRTRKKDVIEKMFRQGLTDDAIRKMDRRREKERRRNEQLEAFRPAEEHMKREENMYRASKEKTRSDDEKLYRSSKEKTRSHEMGGPVQKYQSPYMNA